MQYKKLGKTGLKVSEICLGTMTFGDQVGETEAINIVKRAATAFKQVASGAEITIGRVDNG